MIHFHVILLIIFAVATRSYHAKELSKCDRLASSAAWRDQNTVAETSLKTLAGTWTSERCETRPGPEYVLRSYSFTPQGDYTLIQHHYWDESCSSPKLTILSHGRIQLRNSLIQPEASNGLAKPSNISIVPQDSKAAIYLDKLVQNECPRRLWKTWRRNEDHLVFDSRQEYRPNFNLWSQYYQPISNNNHGPTLGQVAGYISCLGSLKYTFNELKLLKVQFRPIFQPNNDGLKQMEMELLLGDIHSNKKRREFYSPTSFQVPLTRQTKAENVTLARKRVTFEVRNTNPIVINMVGSGKTPPHLIEKPRLPPYIWGEWSSTRCEVRPLDVYLLRRFSFNELNFEWIGEHKFFSDPFCTYLKFIVTASGHFSLTGENGDLHSTTNIDLQIEKATLNALDEKVIRDMKLEGVCGLGWRPNEAKDLALTNGCINLGIFVPSIRYDVVKLEMDYNGAWLLFMGQADTNNLPTGPEERPTAFQLPMVKCGEVGSSGFGESPARFSGFFERGWYENSAGRNFLYLSCVYLILGLYLFR